MNILFFFEAPVIPTKGGVQRVSWNLSCEFQKKGHNVWFLSLKNDDKDYDDDFRRSTLPNNQSIDNVENRNWLIQYIKNEKIDIIINQQGISRSAYNLFSYVREITNVRLVSCIHNSFYGGIVNFSSTHSTVFRKLHLSFLKTLFSSGIMIKALLYLYIIINRKFYTSLYDKSDLIVLLTETMKKEFLNVTSVSNTSKIVIIPNGIPIDTIQNIPKKEKMVLFVGRIDFDYKRAHLLVPIWKELKSMDKDIRLVILGDGVKRKELESLFKHADILDVEFLGWRDPTEYYEKAMCILMTSCTESFGMVLIEAMAHAVVPFCYKAFPELNEIVDDNINGVLIADKDEKEMALSICNFLNSPERIQKMQKASMQRAACFDIEQISNKWLEKLSEIYS